MTNDEYIEIMKALEAEYDYFISMGNFESARAIMVEMETLQSNYGRA